MQLANILCGGQELEELAFLFRTQVRIIRSCSAAIVQIHLKAILVVYFDDMSEAIIFNSRHMNVICS